MASKRKRNRPGHKRERACKRRKTAEGVTNKGLVVKEALLAQYYPKVLTLRDFLLSKLPQASKVRRRKISSLGRKDDKEQHLGEFLDQTLTGLSNNDVANPQERLRQWSSFSQRADTSDSTLANLSGVSIFSQSEIVDFAIWLMFSKSQASNERLQHLLCQGFCRDVNSRTINPGENPNSAIPGVISAYPNSHVITLKSSPWPRILGLLGKEGERVMVDLILDCGIFTPIENSCGSYFQLSGHPLGELQRLEAEESNSRPWPQITPLPVKRQKKDIEIHTPGSISIVRNRILYARAALNAHGGVQFGLRHIHMLNRAQHSPPKKSTTNSGTNPSPQLNVTHLMYLFPLQFGLHNVFTSSIDPRETVQPFKDYTMREDEINAKFDEPDTAKIPKRLRGKALKLVEKLQKLHNKCPYKLLLEHYCSPMNQAPKFEQVDMPDESVWKMQKSISHLENSNATDHIMIISTRKPSLMDYATPESMVSAFCRAVLLKLIPHEFWGTGEVMVHNLSIFHRNVDRFIGLRRFESLTLHELSQGIKITGIDWLEHSISATQKLSQSDLNKRWEIFHEFLYYLFDSILVPLIRANFYVTESNVHRYRLFYFRHDVWRSLAEPALATLKLNMFEEIKQDKARNILDSRTLGFSQVRLLPKETGIRPIMNLRRRVLKKGQKNTLGSSINSILAPVHNMLTLEKAMNPSRFGSALFSVGDLYEKLKSFKSNLRHPSQPLYFVKVDVQAAFDTIPQSAVINLMTSLPSEFKYRIAKHLEMKPGDGYREDVKGHRKSKPIRKWTALARSSTHIENFDEDLENDLAVGRKNTIFVENIVNQIRDKDELLDLLVEHIQRNMVKIGKKFYRQKEGIPQGSVLSSMLCNYFYADLEMHHLNFLQVGDSLLLRLIDDFLLITTDRSHAKRFLQAMHNGFPECGVNVNPDKSLVNFEVTVNSKKIQRLVGTSGFPYCGSFVNTRTLDITRDRERRNDGAIADSLTVEFSKTPGKTFHRKILNTFKIQSHAMFLDTSFNSLPTVLSNISSAFVETATKTWTYARCLPVGKQPGTKLMIKTITDLISLAFISMKSNSKKRKHKGYQCAVSKAQVEFLALGAFREVLGRKQSKYRKVLEWLEERISKVKVKGKGVKA